MRYPNGHQALNDVSLQVRPGEMVAVLGSNGSGKSTLLRCITRLVAPTSGLVRVDGQDLAALEGAQLRAARRGVGVVFQSPALVRRRSVIANVIAGALGRSRGLGCQFGRLPRDELPFAAECLEQVGLLDFAHRRADTLSGGQAQRVAVARALCQRPVALLADEPVASLDPDAAVEVMQILRRLTDEQQLCVVVILHQPELGLSYADRVVGLRAGSVAFDSPCDLVDEARVRALYRSAPEPQGVQS
ncbi:phosphonate ABC transporter ATP-binding protein [Actinopolymorpha pittospori]|uniref:Phosphonate transport system ATP-binding protein n=2 Tax=Actinopolymorpha pittospori TaxID=648752 RepID=A0A927MQH1_9ACTN|nr:phosphonate transport system ATP-binding protein [Actinopolymorpha pittospori]